MTVSETTLSWVGVFLAVFMFALSVDFLLAIRSKKNDDLKGLDNGEGVSDDGIEKNR